MGNGLPLPLAIAGAQSRTVVTMTTARAACLALRMLAMAAIRCQRWESGASLSVTQRYCAAAADRVTRAGAPA